MQTLQFEKIRLLCGTMEPESAVPSVFVQQNIQNQTCFDLDEYDEIYEAYGQRPNAYPYRQQDGYCRRLTEQEVDAAILENDLMKAVFLPGYGGRLWQLTDKKRNRDVLYTNDCLRASNLATRNAWFSGGSEWNCGIIGHSPFTMDRIFAARVEQDGCEFLRMYAYERTRGVVYQMDFWLDSEVPALNAHMSVHNSGREVVPMYWWTNMASPLYPGGRLLVPAHSAYSYDEGTIVKVPVPEAGKGMNASRYESVPISKDFFFDLDPQAPRWIANVDRSGRGMIHSSTARLRSRKLFVWGQQEGSHHWQSFLTEHAGPYIELQAGLGKTQYGCIPMAPHTTWEWTERFENIDLTPEQTAMDFESASASVSAQLDAENRLAAADQLGQKLLRIPGIQMFAGTGDAALENLLRHREGRRPLWEHLDYSSGDSRQQDFHTLLETGILPEPADFPAWDPIGADWLQLVMESVRRPGGDHWYAWYCVSLLQRELGRQDLAEAAIRTSLERKITACGSYVHAVYQAENGKTQDAVESVVRGLELGRANASYARASMQLLIACQAWQILLEQIELLPEQIRAISRIRLNQARGLYELGRFREAMAILEENGGMQLDDVREGEMGMGDLWNKLNLQLTGQRRPVPRAFDFDALGAGYE